MQRGSDDEKPLEKEVAELRKRVAELEQKLAEAHRSGAAPRDKGADKQEPLSDIFSVQAPGGAALLDAIPAMVFFKDRDHRYLLANKAYGEHYHLPLEKIIGKQDEEIFEPDTARRYHENDEAIMTSGVPQLNVELQWTLEDGKDGWTLENNVPYRDSNGHVIGMVGVVIDMTARKKTEQALRRTETELLATKERLLETVAALSTPVLPIDHGLLVLPLVGHIDTTRSGQIMGALLLGVARYDADFVIIDLTGVPMVDSAVALHLLRAIQAVSLLGAQCILVGISGSIARSMAHTGEALEGLIILRDLRAGVRYASERRKAVALTWAQPQEPA